MSAFAQHDGDVHVGHEPYDIDDEIQALRHVPCGVATFSDDERAEHVCPAICPTRTPEVHLLGEFPMTCYRCHIEADS